MLLIHDPAHQKAKTSTQPNPAQPNHPNPWVDRTHGLLW